MTKNLEFSIIWYNTRTISSKLSYIHAPSPFITYYLDFEHRPSSQKSLSKGETKKEKFKYLCFVWTLTMFMRAKLLLSIRLQLIYIYVLSSMLYHRVVYKGGGRGLYPAGYLGYKFEHLLCSAQLLFSYTLLVEKTRDSPVSGMLLIWLQLMHCALSSFRARVKVNWWKMTKMLWRSVHNKFLYEEQPVK